MHTFFVWREKILLSEFPEIYSAKILFLPPKYEIIVVPSNHSFFFSIAPCKVITLNPFRISSLLLFDVSLSKVIALPTIAIAKRSPLLFSNAFKSVKDR